MATKPLGQTWGQNVRLRDLVGMLGANVALDTEDQGANVGLDS